MDFLGYRKMLWKYSYNESLFKETKIQKENVKTGNITIWFFWSINTFQFSYKWIGELVKFNVRISYMYS